MCEPSSSEASPGSTQPSPTSACPPSLGAFVSARLALLPPVTPLPRPPRMTLKEHYPGYLQRPALGFFLAGGGGGGGGVQTSSRRLCVRPLNWFQRVLNLRKDIHRGALAPWGVSWRGVEATARAWRPPGWAHPVSQAALFLSVLYVGIPNETSTLEISSHYLF